MIPARFAPILFGFLLSGMMSCLISAIATWRTAGFIEGFGGLWMSAWLSSWAVAFPIVLVVAPITRKLVARLVKPES
jgi:hypothetical protein